MSTEPQASFDSSKDDEHRSSVIRRKRNRRNLIVAAVLLLGLGGGYFWLQKNSTAVNEDRPLIATVTFGNIENTIASSGSLQPSDFVDVGAQVSGQLQKLYVEVGDLVEEGELLAEIDARVQENKVEASRASIEALEAQLAARQASLELSIANAKRQQRLMGERATSQLDYDTAVSNLASAESSLIQLQKQIIQSRASLASDVTQLEFSKIYAPTAGTVVSIEMSEGRTLNANQQAPTILRIADLSLMTVETEISEADIGNVKKGMRVYFTTLGGGKRRWYSTLRQILPTPVVENNVVLYTGLFDIINDDGALLSEMTAQVYFITSSAENALMVPVGALNYDLGGEMAAAGQELTAGAAPGGLRAGMRAGMREGFAGRMPDGLPGGERQQQRKALVKVQKSDGSLEDRQIVVGVTSRISAQVLSGLEEGDKVVAGILQAAVDAPEGNSGGFRGPGGFGRF